jgi:hypothetical protein
MAQGFDEEAAERWYQSRVGVRHADSSDPMGRFRNTSRSMIVDSKNYTGGALRGAVSDRRAEWMGGGAGGRLGEDWRNHQMIDVDRHGSGLDPFSYAAVKGIKGKLDKGRQRRALGRVMKDQTAKADSAAQIDEMRSWRDAPAEEPAAAAETPAAVEPAEAAKAERVISPDQRAKMDKRNERARQRRAQGTEAISMLASYSLGDESPSSPMWGGGPAS